MKTFAEWVLENHSQDEGIVNWLTNPFKVANLATKYPRYAAMLTDLDANTKASLEELFKRNKQNLGQSEEQTLDGLQRLIQSRMVPNLAAAVSRERGQGGVPLATARFQQQPR